MIASSRGSGWLFPTLGLGILLCPSPGWSAAADPALVSARRGMVASDSSLASQVGAKVLAQGGNAADAACATALALGVTHPFASGLGGGGFALIYTAKTGKVEVLDFRETAPAAVRPELFLRAGKLVPSLSVHGGLAVGVPGEAAGLATLVQRWGKRSFAACIQPAERLARGFPASSWLVEHVNDLFRKEPETANKFLSQVLRRPRGPLTALRAGDRVERRLLAHTLSTLRRQGVGSLYRGDLARTIVRSVRAAGGVLSPQDLAGYAPVEREPLQTTFQGRRVFTLPPPSAGGVILVQALGILAHRMRTTDLVSAGPYDPDFLHVVLEALKHGFADRGRALGDPAFVRTPLATLLDEEYLHQLSTRIRPDRTLPLESYGMTGAPAGTPARDAGTAHLSVVDADGNAVALTTTINLEFGARLVAGSTGIVLNNEMDDFVLSEGQPDAFGLVGGRPNLIAPGKRPLSSMTPIIVLGSDGVEMVLGAAGGPSIISSTLQVLLDVLIFGMDAARAERAPRLHHQWKPDVLRHEPDFPVPSLDRLRAKGHQPEVRTTIGKVNLIIRNRTGLMAAPEPRSGGRPAGY